MSHWSECINEQLGSTGLDDVKTYTLPVVASATSPIDDFYIALEALLAAGSPEAMGGKSVLGPLLAVGLVSATENYLRGVFSGILKICPVSRKKAAEHAISFGSVLWYGDAGVERSAFEHVAFSSKENIISAARKFISYELRSSPLQSHLDYFEEVCELRHCIVHSASYVQGKNAVALELPKSTSKLAINIGYAQLQEIAVVCSGLVRAFNTELFKITAQRWASDWRKGKAWTTSEADQHFKEVWDLFFSKKDKSRAALVPSYQPKQCQREIKKQFGL